MKAYVYTEYNGNIGTQEVYKTEDDAVKMAKYSWDHTTDREKKRIEWCQVLEIEASEEQLEAIADGDWPHDNSESCKEIWSKGQYVK